MIMILYNIVCVVLVNRYLNCAAPELGGVICMIYVSSEYIVPGQWNSGGGGRT